MFGLEIATLLLGISFIAAGMIQSRKTGQKKWRILMIIGIIPVLVSVFLLVCTFWLLYGIQVQEPVAGPTENGKIITENRCRARTRFRFRFQHPWQRLAHLQGLFRRPAPG